MVGMNSYWMTTDCGLSVKHKYLTHTHTEIVCVQLRSAANYSQTY